MEGQQKGRSFSAAFARYAGVLRSPSRRKVLGVQVVGYLLFVMLGMAPQLLQNSIFTETPIFSDTLPENDAISGIIVAAFMTANVLTALYFVLHAYMPLRDGVSISVILGVSVYLAICSAFLWDSVWNGHSIGIISMSFVAAVLGNTSVMVFFALATKYPPVFTSALAVGYSCSGLVTFGLGLVQRDTSPKHATFSPTVFFAIVAVLIAFFSLSFVVLEFFEFGRVLRNLVPDEPIAAFTAPEKQEPLQMQSPLLIEGVITTAAPMTDESGSEDSTFSMTGMLLSDDPDTNSLLSPLSSPSSAFSKSISPAGAYPMLQADGYGIQEEEAPSHSINDAALPFEEEAREVPASLGRRLLEIAPVMLLTVYINALMFYAPGVFPYQTDTDSGLFWLNATFLVLPSIGAAFSSLSIFRFYRLWIFAIIQSVLFLALEVPSFEFMEGIYENPLWMTMGLMAIFAIVTGYMNTIVYLKLRTEVQSGKILTNWKIETLCRLAGLLSQIGGMCGVLFNILFISLGAYSDPVDDDDSCWLCDD